MTPFLDHVIRDERDFYGSLVKKTPTGNITTGAKPNITESDKKKKAPIIKHCSEIHRKAVSEFISSIFKMAFSHNFDIGIMKFIFLGIF